MTDVAVIGGGPAGMMAAASAARVGAKTVLLEKNEKLGKKLFLTGHGRCNVTNSSDTQTYMKKIWRNPKFMLSALHAFTPDDLEAFLRENGVDLKEEESGRKFPASDHSSDIIKAFRKELERDGVEVRLNEPVKSLRPGFVLETDAGPLRAKSVIIATGGLSYPSTGSTGDGYRFAQELGHGLSETGPALVGFDADIPESLAGITLGNVGLEILSDGRRVAREEGAVLFTHSGLSGPAIFRASCSIAPGMKSPFDGYINFKPDLADEELSALLIDTIARSAGRKTGAVAESLVPRRIAPLVLRQAGISADRQASQLTRTERRALGNAVSAFHVPEMTLRPVSEAIITQGGVPVKELDPKTMQSRLVPGLFFAGEVADVSAMTGGYNLQIAFSMGWKAGRESAQYARYR